MKDVKPILDNSLDNTLVQLRPDTRKEPKQSKDKKGNSKDKKLLKRAQGKYLTNKVVLRLVDLDSPLNKHYWNVYYCSHSLKQEGEKVTTNYCNSRICNNCNRIRTAKLMKGYISQLRQLGELYYVTLTIPNCKANKLKETIESMGKTIRIIQNNLRKNYPTSGLRKLEVTYNSNTNTYHPHYHILIEGKESAEYLQKRWLELNLQAKKEAQNIIKANEDSYTELFKYSTKIQTAKQSKDNEVVIFVKAIDVIMQAMKGKRAFQPFGKMKKVSEEVSNLDSQKDYSLPIYDSLTLWIWENKANDWVSIDGEIATGFVPQTPPKIVYK